VNHAPVPGQRRWSREGQPSIEHSEAQPSARHHDLACLTLAAMLLPPCSAAQSTQPLLAADGIVPIAIERAPELFHQCSRSAPLASTEVWLPSREQTSELEQALPAYIARRRSSGRKAPADLDTYFRQYVGFTRNGESLVYANLFPRAVATHPRPAGAPVRICDGGSLFWGIAYNLGKHSFEPPQFNGPP
jgi:hypothetical protein